MGFARKPSEVGKTGYPSVHEIHQCFDGKEDLPRLDIPPAGLVEENRRKIVEMLEFLVPQVDAIIVQDQSEIPGTGCIDEEVRKKLIVLRKLFPEKLFVADSRNWLEAFSGFLLKPNLVNFLRSLKEQAL